MYKVIRLSAFFRRRVYILFLLRCLVGVSDGESGNVFGNRSAEIASCSVDSGSGCAVPYCVAVPQPS